jgi:S-DNA-T family DNA segregation ATPase FtsK/SpoIIIE
MGCVVLQHILVESKGNKIIFLKKLNSLRYDEVFRSGLEKKFKKTLEIIENEVSLKIEEPLDLDCAQEIKRYEDIICGFLNSMKYEVEAVDTVVSNSIYIIKIKLPRYSQSINKIKGRLDDLKLALEINNTPIYDIKDGYLCFDIPRKKREIVYLNDIINRIEYKSSVNFPLGISRDNEIVSVDLASSSTPHLLIAGATGQGKSECLKSIIATLIQKNSIEDLKLTLIDPKHVEFSRFQRSSFLNESVITDVDKAIEALESMIEIMEDRYEELTKYEVNNIDKFNKRFPNRKMCRHLIIFDEFADFVLSNKKNKERIEKNISRLSGKARAAGIHLILATQRPDKDIITGVIKSNLPAQIAFTTTTGVNSSIIIDSPQASMLLGKGDMLLQQEGVLTRIQGAFISDEELDEKII